MFKRQIGYVSAVPRHNFNLPQIYKCTSAHTLLLTQVTGRTRHRYHAWVCGFRSGVTSPELLITLSYCDSQCHTVTGHSALSCVTGTVCTVTDHCFVIESLETALNKLLEPLAQGASRFEKLLAPLKIHWPPILQTT